MNKIRPDAYYQLSENVSLIWYNNEASLCWKNQNSDMEIQKLDLTDEKLNKIDKNANAPFIRNVSVKVLPNFNQGKANSLEFKAFRRICLIIEEMKNKNPEITIDSIKSFLEENSILNVRNMEEDYMPIAFQALNDMLNDPETGEKVRNILKEKLKIDNDEITNDRLLYTIINKYSKNPDFSKTFDEVLDDLLSLL